MKFFTTPENQAKWSMNTGYVAVRNPLKTIRISRLIQMRIHTLVPLQQAMAWIYHTGRSDRRKNCGCSFYCCG
ncbi:MAG: hypothetical protein ACLUUO_20075 [Sellimonas intestinalis]